MNKRLRLLVLLSVLAGCAAPPPPVPPPPAPADSADWYRQAQAAGKTVLPIDSANSLITVVVRRGGPLARMGHDHVVASRQISGLVAPAEGRADFSFRLDQMSVDESGLRREAGLTTVPDSDAIAGTRENMLKRVLQAEQYPLVQMHVEAIDASHVRLAITLHGVTRTMVQPIMRTDNADSVTASGSLTLLQSDFGITPMSVMGGAMVVLDPMELHFQIRARRAPSAPGTNPNRP